MSFTLRIFFIGLIAFVPSPDDQKLSVLLLDARNGYEVSDGTRIPVHQPLLVVRAGNCDGECGGEAALAQVAKFLFPMKTTTQAGDTLFAALHRGGAWTLDGSDLSIENVSPAALSPLRINRALRKMLDGKPDLLPQTPEESKDFSWVAELDKIDPQLGTVDPDVLLERPQKGLIVARLPLTAGEVSTYRLVGVDDQVYRLDFRTLKGEGAKASYSQALAEWVVAEIQVPGDAVRLVERRFDGKPGRTMTIKPEGGVIELALLNMPQGHADPAAHGMDPRATAAGKHFEMFYGLSSTPPSTTSRPVPQILSTTAAPPSRQSDPGSPLLKALELGPGRGAYDPVICPVAQFRSAPLTADMRLPSQGGESLPGSHR